MRLGKYPVHLCSYPVQLGMYPVHLEKYPVHLRPYPVRLWGHPRKMDLWARRCGRSSVLGRCHIGRWEVSILHTSGGALCTSGGIQYTYASILYTSVRILRTCGGTLCTSGSTPRTSSVAPCSSLGKHPAHHRARGGWGFPWGARCAPGSIPCTSGHPVRLGKYPMHLWRRACTSGSAHCASGNLLSPPSASSMPGKVSCARPKVSSASRRGSRAPLGVGNGGNPALGKYPVHLGKYPVHLLKSTLYTYGDII